MSEAQGPTPAEMYEQYFGPAIFSPLSRVLLERAAPQAGERVLDLACGTGIVTREVALSVGPKGRVVGLDMNPSMLAVAKSLTPREGARIEWRQGDAVKPELPNDAFDLVLCQQGFQFFANRAEAARQMHRVLAPGGRVVLSVWEGLARHPVYEAIFEAEARHLGAPVSDLATPFALPEGDAIHAILHVAGFERIDMEEATIDVRFPSRERFVDLTLLAAAAVIPGFAELDPDAKAALVEAVRRDTAGVVDRHGDGDGVRFPMHTHLCVAHAD